MKNRKESHRLLLIVLVLALQACGDVQYVEQYCAYETASQGFGLPEYTQRTAQNDVTVFYYDSNMVSKMPQPEWLRNTEEQELWQFINSISDRDRHFITEGFHSAVNQYNLTGSLSDVNIYQCYGCCQLYPDGKYTAFVTHSFNGKDFLSLDIEKETFIAAVPQAGHFVHLRNSNIAVTKDVLNFYRNMCWDRLRIFRNAPEVTRTEVPEVTIFQVLRGHNVIVTCHVTGFYPRAVQIDLLDTDLQPVDSVSTEILPNEDGTYQTRKSVVIPTEDADKHTYTCVVLHSSVPGNITKVWVHEKRCRIGLWICILFLLASGVCFAYWRPSQDDGS